MNELLSTRVMNEQDLQISEIVAEEQSRLGNFIRRRVADPADAEDILQEVFLQTGGSQSLADAD
jgi:DNA-directed RNA polymerase specialized sigma24 family protein